MDAKIIWLFAFVVLYWSYCIFWGIKGAFSVKTASDYFIAGRSISVWVFILAATATIYSGWTFLGHPGLIYRDGFQYAYASFYAIVIPFTGVLFLKRQWIIGKRFGFITPGEMFADYFKSDTVRILVVFIAMVFSIPYLGVQLRASGFLFYVLTDGMLSVEVGMWLLSAVVVIYVASGGLRAVAYVDTMQAILLTIGIVIIGVFALQYVGGWEKLKAGIVVLAQTDTKHTPEGYSHYIAIPGAIQFVNDTSKTVGGVWTGMMILTYMFALMGIESSPAFSMWAFSNNSPKPFAPQQVWVSSLLIGFVFMTFTAIQGMSGHFLGADLKFLEKTADMPKHKSVVNDVMGKHLSYKEYQDIALARVTPEMLVKELKLEGTTYRAKVEKLKRTPPGQLRPMREKYLIDKGLLDEKKTRVDIMATLGPDMIVLEIMALIADFAPWLVGFLAVCALAAMQSTASPYMSTAGAMLTRDILKRYVMPNASHSQQKFWGRIGVVLIVLVGLIVASTATDALVLMGGLAVAYGLQMWPALIAICWWPFLTRQGIVVGLIAGIVAVTLTEGIVTGLPWGRWPLTIHSAGWGIFCNLVLTIVVSAMTQNKEELAHRLTFHSYLREHDSLSKSKRWLIPVGWIITIAWFFFAVGPGAVIGNTMFGNPKVPATWVFGIPSIWTWQLLFWALGVFMMWFLAYFMELSTLPHKEIVALQDDIGDIRMDISRPG